MGNFLINFLMSQIQGKNWVFTLNNYKESDCALLQEAVDSKMVKYVLYQREIAPETGTPHLQGMLIMARKCGLKAVKMILPKAHLEYMRGTLEQSQKYCTKLKSREGQEPTEIGEFPVQGKRSDLDKLTREVLDGANDELALADKYESKYLRTYKGIRELIRMVKEKKPAPYKRKDGRQCHILFGKTGVGKTWRAEEFAIQMGLSMKLMGDQIATGFWDGYAGEEAICIEDFTGRMMRPQLLFNLIDGVTEKLSIKGAFVDCKAKYILITTDTHPINWWPEWVDEDLNHWAQVRRRVTIQECLAKDDARMIKPDDDAKFAVRVPRFVLSPNSTGQK